MLHAGPNFLQSFQDAPHGNADFDEETTKFCGCSARECNFHQNFQDAPHGRAILNEKMTKFSGCSARDRNCLQNFLDAPHGGAISFQIFRILRRRAISFKIFRVLRTGTQFRPNFQAAPHRSFFFQMKMLRTGARLSSELGPRKRLRAEHFGIELV